MAKYTTEDIKRIANRLRVTRTRAKQTGDHAAHFLIGAGCSISAGIPSAMDLVKEIQLTWPDSRSPDAGCGKVQRLPEEIMRKQEAKARLSRRRAALSLTDRWSRPLQRPGMIASFVAGCDFWLLAARYCVNS